jgi:signal transduction histidine kinase
MNEKILLVDDREDNLFSIETILEPDGYQFVKASSGRETLKILLSEFDFALILMDVKMPNLSGFETAALIYEREKLRNIPIIFITAHNYGDDNIFKGYQAGAVDYIYKPINPGLLRAKVGVFVELYKKNQKLLAQEQKLITINKNLEAEINERKISEEKIKALNLQLLQNIDKLETANKDLDRFAFMASHDLQEPLRKIRTFCDVLSRKYNSIDEEADKYLSRIQSAANRMQTLIKDILTFSKVSTQKNEFVKSNLNVLMEEVLTDFEVPVRDLKAKVMVDKLPDLYINPNLMRPLFSNIISNSLKYSKKEESLVIKIHSDFRDENTGSKYCRIFFEDNGIGFDQKYSEQIFKMFKRLHNHNEYEGTGIGLALCKKIVEEHGGYISAISSVGKGSTFIISLPSEIAEAIDAAPKVPQVN